MTDVLDSETGSLSQEEIDALSYEDGYSRLQTILEALEETDLPLEDALSLYESGTLLATHCIAKLESAELRVRAWREGSDAEPLDDWENA